jgi:hypothetical protein
MYHAYINMKVATKWWKYNRKKEVSSNKLMRILLPKIKNK